MDSHLTFNIFLYQCNLYMLQTFITFQISHRATAHVFSLIFRLTGFQPYLYQFGNFSHLHQQSKYNMGQAIWCFGCTWISQLRWNGVSASCLICNCWLCIPPRLALWRGNEIFKCGGCDQGCGSDLLCGIYYCIPEWLKKYSLRETISDFRGNLGDIQIVSAPQGNFGTDRNFVHPY